MATSKHKGFIEIEPGKIDPNNSEFWLYDAPEEVQLYLQSKRSKMCIALLKNGKYYTEAMRSSEYGTLKQCIKFLEEETGEKQ